MRNSLIYNYLRELGVKMLQNAYKHPCSKHPTTCRKGTIFYLNSHKKTNKKHRRSLKVLKKRLISDKNAKIPCFFLFVPKKISNFGQKFKD